ncbi:MAG: restriction endonuclease [Candidatus Kapaibacterium sp.]|nr:MAG: restriction endonuclease [Candidatus Kapabacteria bacterium]
MRIISLPEPHTKASESYVELEFLDGAERSYWSGLVPYQYRRTGLFLDDERTIAAYLEGIAEYFQPNARAIWIQQEIAYWNEHLSGRTVTKPFFDELAKLEWTSAFPANDNPQRRIQDIKEMGYTIASRRVGQKTERLLLPLPRGLETGYEALSKAFRAKALRVLEYVNVYEISRANKAGLLPDHKFPEIRWDAHTKAENPETMSDEAIRSKFQLIDNQRNQQKREVCRQCFQTNQRGQIFGIDFFAEGDNNWATNFIERELPVVKIGAEAEIGCLGCPWYDIDAWRKALNRTLAIWLGEPF